MLKMTIPALILVMTIPAWAEPLTVETDRTVYHYGDTLALTIVVEELTEDFATMHIRDATGKTSSPIHIPISGHNTIVPPPAPFDRTVFPAGTYEVSVTYAGITAVAIFDLVDMGTVVVPNWIKEIAYLWISGAISDADYIDMLGMLADEGLLEPSQETIPSIPAWLRTPTAWWLGGLVSDEAYVMMLQYLVDSGVITGLRAPA